MASGTYTDLHEMVFDGLPGIGHMVDEYGYAASVEYGMVLDRLDSVVKELAKLLDLVTDSGIILVVCEEDDGE